MTTALSLLLVGAVSYSCPTLDSCLGPKKAEGRRASEILIKNAKGKIYISMCSTGNYAWGSLPQQEQGKKGLLLSSHLNTKHL